MLTRTASFLHSTVLTRLMDVLMVARPQFWPVSWLTLCLGSVLATHQVVPRPVDLGRTALAVLITGPLVWGAVLAVNDAYDLSGDRLNGRKRASPVLTGRIGKRSLLRLATVTSVVAVCAAIPLGKLFALGVAGTVLLGWAYSAPPFRLKERAGADTAVNGLAIGVLGPLGGWVLGAGSLEGFPWSIAVLGWLLGMALYLPTTLADIDADRRAGYRTTAVVLGEAWTARLGCVAWSLAAAWSVGLTLAGEVLPRALLPFHLPLVPIMIILYYRLVDSRVTFRRIAMLASSFLLPCLVFVLTYTGIVG